MSALQKFKRTFSFRKKKKHRENSETSKPIQWQEDERKVREGTCSFQVKYLGCTEVFESRGMQVCEEAIKALKGSFHSKTKQQRAVLYVSGDQLRVVDEISKGLIVDQTIEKVSFCAPDRHHDKGFAYICRDGASRRWMCHGFMSVKESGERLSHAVGCAFAVCLEKKQKREKDAVEVTYNAQGTSFERQGSFRPATLTERLQDPQSAIIAEPVPSTSSPTTKSAEGVAAIPRPRASAGLIDRQGSLRLFPKLADASSPFKRDLSLRLNDLPSTLQRQHYFGNGDEVSPVREEDEDELTKVAKDVTSQLNDLSTNLDPLAPSPSSNVHSSSSNAHRPSIPNGAGIESGVHDAAFVDPFGGPRVRASVPAMPTSFDPFATAPAPFNPTRINAVPSPGQLPLAYQQQPHPTSVSTNPFAAHPQPQMAGATANPWTGAPSPWAPPAPAPRQMAVDRRDGSADPFDVAWAERQARTSDSSTNPFISANTSGNIVARGLPAANANATDKGFRMGV